MGHILNFFGGPTAGTPVPRALILVRGVCAEDGVRHQCFNAGGQHWVLVLVLRIGIGNGTRY